MNVDPRQTDPQYQSPLSGDSEQASQFGMGSQADAPVRPHDTMGSMAGTGALDPSNIIPGAEVYGSDDKRLGTVQEVYEDSFLVQKGIFFVHDYFVPLSFVVHVENDRIDLGLTADEAKSQDWSQRPGMAAMGHGVQADSATDTQQSDLNMQNNVNPSGLDSGMNPSQDKGVIMPNQAMGMGMGMGAAMNPSSSMPTRDDTAQKDQSQLSQGHSGMDETYVAGEDATYGSTTAAGTPTRGQMPATGSMGRTGSADTLHDATTLGMQGKRDSHSLGEQDDLPRDDERLGQDEQGLPHP